MIAVYILCIVEVWKMKPFLGVDLTKNRKNRDTNGQEFVVAFVSDIQAQALDQATDAATELVGKALLPTPLSILRWICGLAALIIGFGLLDVLLSEDSVGLIQGYYAVPQFYWAFFLCLLGWLVLTILGKKRDKDITESPEADHLASRLDTIASAIYDELDIPDSAADVDVLSFTYKQKGDTPVPHELALSTTPYTNISMKAFVQDEQLFLADLDAKYAFPLSELRCIHTVNKSVSLPQWLKDEAPTEGIYKPYKMTVDNYDSVHVKPYHILELVHEGTTWGIYFPAYERPTFETLTGLTAESGK
jgi:hypothetical protein